MKDIINALKYKQINRLFPFYLIINESLRIEGCGRSMVKLIPVENDILFNDYFKIIRPKVENPTLSDFFINENQLVILELKHSNAIKLRGQFEIIENENKILFFGSPWFDDINQLPESGLTIFDFALHDSQIDLLQVLKNQETITSDIKVLLTKLNTQKKELEKNAEQLKANQAQLELLSRIAEETVNGIIITNRKGEIEWINRSFTRITGYVLDEVQGKNPHGIFIGENSNLETVNYIRDKANSGEYFVAEILNYDKFGKPYWAKITGHPLKDSKGKVIKYFTLKEDITARLEAERILKEAKEKADAMAQAKDAFLANMSHEMRTPLNAILGLGKQMLKSSLDKNQHFFLDSINSAAEHLLVVINDILDLSRIEADKMTIENIDFDLKLLVTKCLQGLRPKADEKGLELELLLDDGIANILVGDPFRLNQVLLNLIGNAIKFTEKGHVKIHLTCAEATETYQTLCFTITDTGIGMDDKFKANLFNKFTQEDSSIVRKYGGSGLGLSITKQLVELMGGIISADSQKHTGSTFTLTIKFPIGNIDNISKSHKFDIGNSALKNTKVLVVEDNEMNRILAKTVLNNYKAQIFEAENGLKAIQLMQVETFDIVLMDLQMPVMGGYEATQYIREELMQDMPIIALTANALKGEHIKCIASGMNAYLSKPYNEEDLIMLIIELLHLDPSVDDDKNDKSAIQTAEKQPKNNVVFNLDYLNEMCGNNDDYVRAMLLAFIKEAGQGIVQINGFVSDNNTAGLKSTAHRLKSNLAMLNALELRDLAQKIENIALEGQITDELKVDIEVFNDGIKNIIETLEAEYMDVQAVIA